MMTFQMDAEVKAFVKAHRRLCKHYGNTGLKFTLDGKLVGDLAEIIASKLFELKMCIKRTPGVDCHAPDGRTVQVKATGSSSKGPAFTPGQGRADQLLFLRLDFDKATGSIAYNGPEAPIRRLLPPGFTGTRRVNLAKVLDADKAVDQKDRLHRK